MAGFSALADCEKCSFGHCLNGNRAVGTQTLADMYINQGPIQKGLKIQEGASSNVADIICPPGWIRVWSTKERLELPDLPKTARHPVPTVLYPISINGADYARYNDTCPLDFRLFYRPREGRKISLYRFS